MTEKTILSFICPARVFDTNSGYYEYIAVDNGFAINDAWRQS